MQSMPAENQPTIFVELNHEELLERCDELSGVMEQIAVVEDEKSESLKEFKERLKPLTARQGELQRAIRMRKEERPAQRNLFDPEDDVPREMRSGPSDITSIQIAVNGKKLPPVSPAAMRAALDEVKRKKTPARKAAKR